MRKRSITGRRRGALLRASPGLAALILVGCGGDGGTAGGAPAVARLESPAEPGSGQPHLAVTAAGQVVLSWLQPAEEGHSLNYSVLSDGQWSAPATVARGDDFFVNWADFPSVEPITADVWAAHWLKMAPDTFASYDIVLALSTDGGQTWSDGELLNVDGVLTEHGFASLFPWGGDIGAVWLDGRRIAAMFESDEFDIEGPPVGVSLRYARIGYDGNVSERGELDELVCDCCQTDAAPAGAGPVIVYRDRSHDEIRDIAVRRHDGSAWQPELTVGADNWRIEGCPVNGPAVAADEDEVVVAWFTAPESSGRVRFARSTDGGVSFGGAIEIDADGAFGHVDVVLLADDAAAVSWWRAAGAGRIELAVRRVEPDGTLGIVHTVAENEISQPLDVPQMVAAGGALVFAWTDAGDDTRDMTVETAVMPLAGPASR